LSSVRVAAQRLVELFVEAVTRVLAWVDEYKAYHLLMTAVAAGVVALAAALNMWGLDGAGEVGVYAASVGAPFFPGRTKTGGKAAERFKTLGERYERWRVDEGLVDGVLKAPMRGERPYAAFLKLFETRRDLPPPLVELRRALKDVKDEVLQDAAVVAVLVLYKTLVKNAGVYKEWAGWYDWARSLVERQEFTVTAGEIKRLRETHRRLEEVAEEVRRELNAVLTLYKSHSRDLYEKLRPHLEVDVKKAEELAEAGHKRLSDYSNANMGTKAYAALLFDRQRRVIRPRRHIAYGRGGSGGCSVADAGKRLQRGLEDRQRARRGCGPIPLRQVREVCGSAQLGG
jgi:hypothetical protein